MISYGRMSQPSIQDICPANGTSTDARISCVSDHLQSNMINIQIGVDTFYLIWAGVIVFMMQAGFAMISAGSVRRKNVHNTLLKNLIDACGSAIGFWSLGYALAYGSNNNGPTTFIGGTHFFLHGVDDLAFWFFQYAFASSCVTIVAGSLAERCQLGAYFAYAIALTSFVYPIVLRALWSSHGFLSPHNQKPLWETGAIDFAGGGVVHLTGGFTALVAVIILGPRAGRFYDESGNVITNPLRIRGYSVSLQILGTFLLWIGWYGFNAGSALTISSVQDSRVASLAVVCTSLGAATGCVSSLGLSTLLTERRTGEYVFDVTYALNGCLAGLVSTTAACGVIEPWAAIVIGTVGGFLYVVVSETLIRFKIDDAVDAIPVHLTGGAWSVIAVGLFASPRRLEAAYGLNKHVGWFYSWGRGSADATLLAANTIELLFIIGWVSVTMIPFFLLLNYFGWFRSDPLDELVGLDVRYHEAALFRKEKKIVLVSSATLGHGSLHAEMDPHELSLSDRDTLDDPMIPRYVTSSTKEDVHPMHSSI